MKKVRGVKRKLRWLQQACTEIDSLSMDMLQTYHYDYSRLGLGPWHWHDWQGRRPPRVVRQLAASKLINTALQWHSFLLQQSEPFYLGVHLTQTNFAHDSQVIVAIQDRIARYQEEPDPQGPPLPEEYRVLPGADQLTWTTYPQQTWLDPDDYPEGWSAWELRRPHYDYQTSSGKQYLIVQIGWIWVGNFPTTSAVQPLALATVYSYCYLSSSTTCYLPMPLPSFRTITPGSLPANEWYQFMVTTVAPRPIAFVSTISAAGEVNLSPYSFFNVFSASPPILIFSATTRARDNSPKDTLLNVREVAECVINIANYSLVEQLSLTSTEYPRGVNEFTKAGFTEVASDKVRPPRAAECPAAYECMVEQIIPLGDTGGSGNLVVCRVVQAHFHEHLLNENGIGLNPHKLEAVARLGGDYYCRVSPENLLEVPRPNRHQGIGFDQLPDHIRHSDILTGNNLGRLANLEASALPSTAEVQAFHSEPLVAYTLNKHHGNPAEQRHQLMLLGKQFLEEGLLQEAWKTLLLAGK